MTICVADTTSTQKHLGSVPENGPIFTERKITPPFLPRVKLI